jgi:SpoVK/Ycf46/Vps4 family AAA+-type ATPase
MIDDFIAFQLTIYTLFFVSLIPFVYFAYRYRFAYRPDTLKAWDFCLLLTAVFVLLVLFAKLVKDPQGWKSLPLQTLYLLHAMPAITVLLLLKFHTVRVVSASSGAKVKDMSDPHSNYTPVPINKEIESMTWNDIIIDPKTQNELIVLVELLKDPKSTSKYGIEVPKGVLLAGPPGTGKTTIAKVIANTAGLSFFALRLDEVVSKWVGESEKNLSRLFQAAQKHAPSLIFIDEVDSIGAQRSGKQAYSDNTLNHLLQLIDGVIKSNGVNVIAATNRPDLVDSALKRAGRLNRIIEIPLPDFGSRRLLFQLYMSRMHLEEQLNIDLLAKITEGKSAADIKGICNQAGLNAFKRETVRGKREYKVSHEDMKAALQEMIGAQR